MEDNECAIEEFLMEVQQEHPQLNVKYDYDNGIDEYAISFNIDGFGFDSEVEETVTALAKSMLIDEGVFNFYFAEDYF